MNVQLREITIEMNTSCNYSCKMCPAHINRFKVGSNTFRPDMTLEVFKELVDQAVKINPAVMINPQKAGEPFVHPDIFEAIEYIKAKDARFQITTNGSYLTPEVNRWLIDLGVENVIVSIDGATKETFEAIRGKEFAEGYDNKTGGSPFELTVGNTLDLIKQRNELGKSDPKIHISYCLQPKNFHEVEAAARFWGMRADTVQVFNLIYDFDYQRVFYPDPTHDRPACTKLWDRLFIMSTGDVVCCSADQKHENVVGNAFNQSLHDIWFGETYNRMREDHLAGRFDNWNTCGKCKHYAPRPHIYTSHELLTDPEIGATILRKDMYSGFYSFIRMAPDELSSVLETKKWPNTIEQKKMDAPSRVRALARRLLKG